MIHRQGFLVRPENDTFLISYSAAGSLFANGGMEKVLRQDLSCIPDSLYTDGGEDRKQSIHTIISIHPAIHYAGRPRRPAAHEQQRLSCKFPHFAHYQV